MEVNSQPIEKALYAIVHSQKRNTQISCMRYDLYLDLDLKQNIYKMLYTS